MQIMIDTNIFISMIFFPSENMNKLKQSLCLGHTIVICSYVIDEIYRVVERKFSKQIKALDEFFNELPYKLVSTPKYIDIDKLPKTRDVWDYPVLASAILENVDILLTGDKDFSEIDIHRPKILTPAEFLNKY